MARYVNRFSRGQALPKQSIPCATHYFSAVVRFAHGRYHCPSGPPDVKGQKALQATTLRAARSSIREAG